MSCRLSILVLLVLLLPTACRQVHNVSKLPGVVNGQVMAEETKWPLVGAAIRIANSKLGALTDLDGKYHIRNVPAGSYTLIITSVSYIQTEVKDVKVEPGRTTRVDASMKKSRIPPSPVQHLSQ
jgi:hypothetical protein